MPSEFLCLIGRMFQADLLKHKKSKNYPKDSSKLFTLTKKLHFYLIFYSFSSVAYTVRTQATHLNFLSNKEMAL